MVLSREVTVFEIHLLKIIDGGGTPDVDADRPSLQLTFGSVDKEERQSIS